MSIYDWQILPAWIQLVAGLVIFQRQDNEYKVLLCLRQKRAEAGMWSLPAGMGALRFDPRNSAISKTWQSEASAEGIITALDSRQQMAWHSPAGFALAETLWYIKLPEVSVADLLVLPGLSIKIGKEGIVAKALFALDWAGKPVPEPAETAWPAKEVKFFTRKEIHAMRAQIAFDGVEDLEQIFWCWSEDLPKG